MGSPEDSTASVTTACEKREDKEMTYRKWLNHLCSAETCLRSILRKPDIASPHRKRRHLHLLSDIPHSGFAHVLLVRSATSVDEENAVSMPK